MGGGESKATMKVLNEKVTTICASVAQKCSINVEQTQTVRDVNTGMRLFGSTKIAQSSDIDFKCMQDANMISNLQNELINTLTQTAGTDGQAIWGAFSKDKSDAIAKVSNVIRNTITLSNLQESYNNVKQTQEASLGNTGITIGYSTTVGQSSKILSNAVMSILHKNGVLDKITTNIENNAKTTTKNPFSFITDIVGSVGDSTMMLILGGIALLLLVFVGFPMLSRMATSDKTTPNDTTPKTGSADPYEYY